MPSKRELDHDDLLENSPTYRHDDASQHTVDPVAAAQPASGGRGATSTSTSKKRNLGPTRAGQACDRCKSRKIRCDDTEGGCLPCRQNNTECKTTDRVTQRVTVRGHTEAVERDNQALRQHIYELEQQLHGAGVEPKPMSNEVSAASEAGANWSLPHAARAGSWRHEAGQVKEQQPQDGQQRDINKLDARIPEANLFALANYQPSSDRDYPVRDRASLPSYANPRGMMGPSLSLFGVRIDLGQFMSTTPSDSSSASFQWESVLACVSGHEPDITAPPPDLPATYEECQKCVEMFLSIIHGWMPVLYIPELESLLKRIYQEPNYTTSPAETAIIHTILAFFKYQAAVRGYDATQSRAELDASSLRHFKYALTMVPRLIHSLELADMQAIAMICVHVRNFSKPYVSWVMTGWAVSLTLESGYHRSAKIRAIDGVKDTDLEAKIKTRVFWCILLLYVSQSGRLGRPMLLRREDYDAGPPEHLEGDERFGGGHDLILATTYELVEIQMDVCRYIYAVRPTTDYDHTLQTFAGMLDRFASNLPQWLSEDFSPNCDRRTRVEALWVQFEITEVRLTLHHPAVCRSKDPEVVASNFEKSMAAAYKILNIAAQLRDCKALDTTWANAAVFINAMLTLLFSHWEQRDQVSALEMSRLKFEIEDALDVLRDVCQVTGSGTRVQQAVRSVVAMGLRKIERYLAEKTASAAVARAALRPDDIPVPPKTSAPPAGTAVSFEDTSTTDPATTISKEVAFATRQDAPPPAPAPHPHAHLDSSPLTTYTQTIHPPYPDSAMASIPNYPYTAFPDNAAFQVPEGKLRGAPLGPGAQAGADEYMFQQHAGPYGERAAWRLWTETIRDDMDPLEYMNSVNALMSLGGGRDGVQGEAGGSLGVGVSVDMMADGSVPAFAPVLGGGGGAGGGGVGQAWPGGMYDRHDERSG